MFIQLYPNSFRYLAFWVGQNSSTNKNVKLSIHALYTKKERAKHAITKPSNRNLTHHHERHAQYWGHTWHTSRERKSYAVRQPASVSDHHWQHADFSHWLHPVYRQWQLELHAFHGTDRDMSSWNEHQKNFAHCPDWTLAEPHPASVQTATTTAQL